MNVGRCAGINVEIDSQADEGVLYNLVITVYDILRGASFAAGLYGDGHAVLVASADEQDIFAAHPEVSHIDVGGDVYSCKVTDVHRSVGIWKRTGDKGARKFIFLTHSYLKSFALTSLSLPAEP